MRASNPSFRPIRIALLGDFQGPLALRSPLLNYSTSDLLYANRRPSTSDFFSNLRYTPAIRRVSFAPISPKRGDRRTNYQNQKSTRNTEEHGCSSAKLGRNSREPGNYGQRLINHLPRESELRIIFSETRDAHCRREHGIPHSYNVHARDILRVNKVQM